MTTEPTSSDARKELTGTLQERAVKSRDYARRNDGWATACHFTAIACSLAVTVAAALEAPKWLVVSLSAVSGAALLSNGVFGFERKAVWHRNRKRKYDSLVQELTFEGAATETISRELRKFEDEIDESYPRFGAIPGSKSS